MRSLDEREGGGIRESDNYEDVPETLTRLRGLDDSSSEARRLRQHVITRCLPLAEHIARRFQGRGEPIDDLEQIARLGLVNAIDRYDVTKGNSFVAFAVPTIMGEVRRYFRDSGWSIHVPRRAKEMQLAIGECVERLSQGLGRSPSAREIARDLDVPYEHVVSGLIARDAYQPASIDAAASDSEGLKLSDRMGGEDPALENAEGYVAIKPHLEALPERERTILYLRFFGGMTQTQIAARIGISQMHVSRILTRTLARLRSEVAEP